MEWDEGMFASKTITSDMDMKQMEAIPDNAMHRDVDLEVLGAAKEGKHICPLI